MLTFVPAVHSPHPLFIEKKRSSFLKTKAPGKLKLDQREGVAYVLRSRQFRNKSSILISHSWNVQITISQLIFQSTPPRGHATVSVAEERFRISREIVPALFVLLNEIYAKYTNTTILNEYSHVEDNPRHFLLGMGMKPYCHGRRGCSCLSGLGGLFGLREPNPNKPPPPFSPDLATVLSSVFSTDFGLGGGRLWEWDLRWTQENVN